MRRERLSLTGIVDAADAAARFLQGVDRDTFLGSELLQSAVQTFLSCACRSPRCSLRCLRTDEVGRPYIPLHFPIISFMISLVPPPIGMRRRSRQVRTMSYSSMKPFPPWNCWQS